MPVMEHVDNINTLNNFKPLDTAELEALKSVEVKIKEHINNMCTGCGYCMPCPAGVNILKRFVIWNSYGMYKNPHDIHF